jgi:hypothetical protein
MRTSMMFLPKKRTTTENSLVSEGVNGSRGGGHSKNFLHQRVLSSSTVAVGIEGEIPGITLILANFPSYLGIEIGTRCTFKETIASITSIHTQFFEEGFGGASIAQKFSWASRRQTLRIEDTAYCLMGLFGVNMPLLYGAGREAFIRLQLEIMKVSDDESLFAWTDDSIQPTFYETSGLLAGSPASFQHSGDIVSLSREHDSTIPYSMTNKGLGISLALIPAMEARQRGVRVHRSESYPRIPESFQFFAFLSCYVPAIPSVEDIHILLRLARRTDRNGNVWYARLCSTRLHQLPSSAIPTHRKKEHIFVPQMRQIEPLSLLRLNSKFAINAKHFFDTGYSISSLNDSTDELIIGGDNVITSRGRAVNADHWGVFILELGTNEEEPMAFVEFKGPESHDPPETFVLQIYQGTDNWETVGIILLLPTGKSLDELVLDARRDRPFFKCDRTSIKLPSGSVISAALRRRVRDGVLMYAVDFDVKGLESPNLDAKSRL